MRKVLHIDYETFSPVDLMKCGVYRYAEEAEIILVQYAFDDEPVRVIDVLSGEAIPQEVIDALWDGSILKVAQNANFERTITKACLGITCPPEHWKCTAVWAASLGLPSSLGPLSDVLKLSDKAKLKTGKALIRKFCMPRKPTKRNPATRLYPKDAPEQWQEFKRYGHNDVEAERELCRRFAKYPMPDKEWQLWYLDQHINDRGIKVDTLLVRNAIALANKKREELFAEAQALTGLSNPNSRDQLIAWLDSEDVITSTLRKEDVEQIIGSTSNEKVQRLMEIRQMMAKSSVKKYEALARAICKDGRLRGAFKFYGAGRTGRWAGQIFQPQNLPSKGLIPDIDLARELLRERPELIEIMYDDTSQMLASLIRPALLAPEGCLYLVADYSAIEGRIVAWLAHEQWRLDLFARGGKLYETSAEKMFNLPPGSVTKGDPNRQKGKVAELALGYQGWVGALITMGALDMGLTEEELPDIASAWRKANPAIEAYWGACEDAALQAMRTRSRIPVLTQYQRRPLVSYEYDGHFLICHLPSGRRMMYAMPGVGTNDRGNTAVYFYGMDSKTKQWGKIWLYGGLYTENQAQAIARDCLAETILQYPEWLIDRSIVMHVHDEVVLEIPENEVEEATKELLAVMAKPLEWAPGLLLKGDSYTTPYYVKDSD